MVAISAVTTDVAAATYDGEPVALARAATAQYRDVQLAEQDGWALPPDGPLHECIEALDGPGAMGLHYINGELAGDTVLDVTQPEALVYEPTADGGRELVAVEYVVFADAWNERYPGTTPELFGRELMYVAEPNRYELPAFYQVHAWLWRDNPDGMHADFNVDASCEHAQSAAGEQASWVPLPRAE
jgi:hypothetical protein